MNNNKKVRLRLIYGIVILLIGIFTLVSYSLKKDDLAIPSFAIFKWYREVDGVKEYIVFNKNNTFEYYDENNESIVNKSCKTYEYNKYKNEINIKCKNTTLNYKVMKYEDDKLTMRFENGDIREFKLYDSDNENM